MLPTECSKRTVALDDDLGVRWVQYIKSGGNGGVVFVVEFGDVALAAVNSHTGLRPLYLVPNETLELAGSHVICCEVEGCR